MLAVVVALGTYAALKIRELNQAIHSVSSVDSETIWAADRLRDSFFTQRNFEKKYIVSGDEDFYRQFQEIEKSIKKDLDQMETLLDPTDNTDVLLLFRENYSKYLLKVREEADLIKNKKMYSEQGFEDSKEAFIDRILRQIEILKKNTRNTINEKIHTSELIGAQALDIIMILSISSVVFAVLIAFYNARTIHRPISLLIKETREIAEGKFEKHLSISSPPEIHELAAAFNHMCDRLKELDEMKADLIARVSHEFRTPLAVIREAVSLFMDSFETASKEKQTKLLGIVHEECERLIASVNKVLNLSRMDAGIVDYHMENYNLSHLIAIAVSKVQPIAVRKGITLEVNVANDSLDAVMDPDKIGQVFDNILGNALKFTPESGRVSIGAVEKKEVSYSKDNSKEFIEISVSDTGPGVPEENIHDVFDKFKKLHEKGTGLGLYIARQIINAHGGEIWVESDGKTGSTFFFTVPVS